MTKYIFQVDGQVVVQDFSVDRIMGISQDTAPYNSSIVGGCPKGQRQLLQHLAGMMFTCSSAAVSYLEQDWLEGLDDHVIAALKALFLGAGQHLRSYTHKKADKALPKRQLLMRIEARIDTTSA